VVSPVLEEGQKGQLLYLPKGEWYHYYTNEQRVGGKMGAVSLEMDYIPFYVRAGAVLPLFPVQQFVGEKIIEKITLKVYAGEAESTLYLDNGEGYDYEKGQFSLRKYQVESSQIHQTIEGSYTGDLQSFELEWIGLKEQPEQLLVDGSSFNFEYKNGVLIAEIPASFNDINIS
jgi:alpha-glucosidase